VLPVARDCSATALTACLWRCIQAVDGRQIELAIRIHPLRLAERAIAPARVGQHLQHSLRITHYLHKRGYPDSPQALAEHDCLRIVNTVMPVEGWVFEGPDGMETVRVLPDCHFEEFNLYAIYPSRKFVDAKTRTWVEFLKDDMPVLLAADEQVAGSAGKP